MSMQDIDKAPANMGMPKKNTDATSSGDGEALGGGKIQEPPSLGSGTGSSGERREEELKSKVPGLQEKLDAEQSGGKSATGGS